MPRAPVPPDVLAFLRRPNPAVVGSLMPDGSPHLAPTWYDVEDDGRIVLSMDHSRLRLRNMRKDPRIALSVLDKDNWYWQVTLLGRVSRIEPDEGLKVIDRLARRYVGGDYPDRDRPRYTAWMEVERWTGWDPVRFDLWEPGVSQPPVE